MRVDDVLTFDAAAAARAVGIVAELDETADAPYASSVFGSATFTLSFSGAAALTDAANATLRRTLASALFLPSDGFVTVSAPAPSRRRLSQAAGSVNVRVGRVPASALPTLRSYNAAAGLADALSTFGVVVTAVSPLAYTVQAVITFVPPPLSLDKLAAAASSGRLQTELASAGAATTGVVGVGCAASPCFPGVACQGAGSLFTCDPCPTGMAGNGTVCFACGALQPPVLAFTTPVLRGSAATFYSTVLLPTGASDGSVCRMGTGFTYSWSVTDATGASVQTGASTALTAPAGTLAVGAASVVLRVCYPTAPLPTCTTSVQQNFTVAASPLSAVISGGGGQMSSNGNAQLDGRLSRDPDNSPDPMTYAWTCTNTEGRACDDLAPSTASMQSLQGLQGEASPGKLYRFSLTVTKAGGRTANASTTMLVIAGTAALPSISIASLAAVDPSARIVLAATVTAATPGDIVTQRWSIVQQPNSTATLDLTDQTKVSTRPTLNTLVFLPDALRDASQYIFRLTATSFNPTAGTSTSAYTDVVVPTAAVYPVPGSLSVGPEFGVALSTAFTVSALNWAGPGGVSELLQYSFAYIETGASTDTIKILTPYRPAASAVVRLPAARPDSTLSLLVFVRSARGATILLSTALQLAVNVSVEEPENAGSDEFNAQLANEALLAATSGQPDAALQLAGGLATSFNSAPSVDAARLQLRESLLAAVTSAPAPGAPVASPSELQALAGALESLTSAPSELSSVARESAVSALSSIASSGDSLNPATASAVMLSLSSVSISGVDSLGSEASNKTARPPARLAQLLAFAPCACLQTCVLTRRVTTRRAPQPQEDLGVLQAVLGAVGNLATSLQGQLTVPGEAAVSFSSPTIQASVALDTVGPDSRLFTSGTSAPGSDASFGALPIDALPENATSVRIAFHSLSFDPYTGLNTTSGSARLLLTDADGNPLLVEGLATPIAIALPPLSADVLLPGSGAISVCTFWNDTSGAYSSDGCHGLPNPLPAGLEAYFNASSASEGAAGAAALAASVVLNATTEDGATLLAGCTVTVLDCSRNDSGVFYLDPFNPFAHPAVRCPPSSDAMVGVGGAVSTSPPALRLYYGSNCALWKASNYADCYWNVTTQAFDGAGCVLSAGPQQCLCRHVRPPACLLAARCALTRPMTRHPCAAQLTDFSSQSAPQIPVATPAQSAYER
jgi:hypothetical protein